jgi:hypothetical protein
MTWKLVEIVALTWAHRVAQWLRYVGCLRLSWLIDEVIGWNAAELRLPQIKRDLRIM